MPPVFKVIEYILHISSFMPLCRLRPILVFLQHLYLVSLSLYSHKIFKKTIFNTPKRPHVFSYHTPTTNLLYIFVDLPALAFDINGILQYMAFYVWLHSPPVFSEFIRIVA